MRRLVISILSLSALLPIAASAQRSYAVGLGGGAVIPVGKLGDVEKTGYSALLTLALGSPDSPIGVRVDGIYNNLTQSNTAAGPATGDLRVTGALMNLVYAFPGTNAKPYVLAGAGWYGSKVDTTGAKLQNNLGFNGGAGITFGFGPAAAFLETRYHSISRTAAKGGVFQFVPITFGLMF